MKVLINYFICQPINYFVCEGRRKERVCACFQRGEKEKERREQEVCGWSKINERGIERNRKKGEREERDTVNG